MRLVLMLTISLSILLGLSWLPLFSKAPAALAHAFVIGSDPVDGSTINTAPSVIRIFFNADISPASNARVYVFAPGGPISGSEVDAGHSYIPANNARELDTPLIATSNLPQGSYEVKWTAIAQDDGHATNGLIGFNLGLPVTGLTGTPILGPSTSNNLPQLNLQGVLSVMWGWLTTLALMFWVGLVTMEALLLLNARNNGDDVESGVLAALRKQGKPLQWLCLSAVLVGEIINLVLRGALLTQANVQNGIDLATLRQIVFETSYGWLWLARITLICLALGFLWWTTRQRRAASPLSPTRSHRLGQLRMQVMEERKKEDNAAQEETGNATEQPKLTPASIAALPTTPIVASPLPTRTQRGASIARWHTIAWLTLAALILLTLAFSSDTAQLAQAHYSAIIVTWLQLLAQAVWFGGAAYLGFVLLPPLTTLKPDHHGDFLLNLLRYYMPLLLASLAVVLLSTLFLTETTISNAGQWLNDPYGRSLLVMLLLFALMLIFTLYSLFYLRPALRRQVILLPVVNADLPGRRARHSALEQTENGLKHTMHILAALGGGVLLCAALMSFFAPPIVFPKIDYKLTVTQVPPSTPNVLTQQAGNLTVSLAMQPGHVGVVNTLTITLKDNATGQPVTNAHIQATTNMQIMDMGTANKELSTADNNAPYTTTFQPGEAFSMIGAWVITLNIQQPGHTAVQTQFVVTLTS
ncbi:MAG TPA: copper resistance protein CopC [Ktedonobacteraceae bacterium]|nr:copper resistance protein CopC [Ktedonobacteraceae bacterium]